MPGVPELLVILLIVLLIFGAGKLPAIGDALGRSIKNFKRSASGADELEVAKKPAIDAKKRSELKASAVDDEHDDEHDDVEDAEVVVARRGAKDEA
jgi:sec-independent protein translocase protein TatA